LENKTKNKHEHGEKNVQMKAHAYMYTDEWIKIDCRDQAWQKGYF